MKDTTPVCDYEGSDYEARFWQGQGREYEDRVERIALRRLLPATGDTLLDVGAGFGRLAGEYTGYRRVVLFDYSRTLLREAQERIGSDPRYLFVAGNWYQMPFVDGLFAALAQVRTLHHAADVPGLFGQLFRVTRPGATYVLEYASKHHLKAIARYWAQRQSWSPFDQEPVEFVDLNFDFHPAWIRRRLAESGFAPGRTLTVSHFRLALLKRLLPDGLLVALDSAAQWTGGWWQLTPSVFVRSRRHGLGETAVPGHFFACPVCATPLPSHENGLSRCPQCGRSWRQQDGLYDFREPAS